MPPTTERAWKPTFLALVVSYQSVSGMRSGVSWRNFMTGARMAAKSSSLRVNVADQRIQSIFV